MRPALALFFAAATWATTCSTPPPCGVLAPDLTVAIAEILETPLPAGDSHVPVRMRLKTLIYGRSPGAEFTFLLPSSYNLPIGSVFYIESRQPLQTEVCGLSGPYNARQKDERIRVFRKLAAAPAQKAAFHVHASGRLSNSLSGVHLTLRNRSDIRHKTTDIEGNAHWRGLPPGRYTLSTSHSDLQAEDPELTLAPVDIIPGSCTGRYVPMLPPYSLTGVAHTPDNRPAQGLPVYLRDSAGASIADTTSGPTGAFTLRNLPAGTYTLFAGDSPGHRSPYPPYLYPGVTSESAATTLKLGPGHQAVPLQINVPTPAPVRTIQLKLPRPLGPMETPILSAGPATIYTRTWSADRTVCTLTIPPTQPLTGSLKLFPSRLEPFEFSIAAGTELVTLPVQLQFAK
jgi:hypothetical protein